MAIAERIEKWEIEGGKRVKKIKQSLLDFFKGKTDQEQEAVMEDVIVARAYIGQLNSE